MQYIKSQILTIIGVFIGTIGGYLYYYYVGCESGSCPIQSNPWKMTAYGALMGGLLFSMFKKENK